MTDSKSSPHAVVTIKPGDAKTNGVSIADAKDKADKLDKADKTPPPDTKSTSAKMRALEADFHTREEEHSDDWYDDHGQKPRTKLYIAGGGLFLVLAVIAVVVISGGKKKPANSVAALPDAGMKLVMHTPDAAPAVAVLPPDAAPSSSVAALPSRRGAEDRAQRHVERASRRAAAEPGHLERSRTATATTATTRRSSAAPVDDHPTPAALLEASACAAAQENPDQALSLIGQILAQDAGNATAR